MTDSGRYYKIELGSVHLDKDDILEVAEMVANYTTIQNTEIHLHTNTFSQYYFTLQELEEDVFIDRNHVIGYNIYSSHSGDGTLAIEGSSSGSEAHEIVIHGKSEWANDVKNDIVPFMEERENPIRTVLSGRILEISVIVAAAFLGNVAGRFAPALMVHVPLRFGDLFWFTISLTFVLTVVFREETYPYVKITKATDSSRPYNLQSIIKFVGISIFLVVLLTIIGGIIDPTRGCVFIPC